MQKRAKNFVVYFRTEIVWISYIWYILFHYYSLLERKSCAVDHAADLSTRGMDPKSTNLQTTFHLQ